MIYQGSLSATKWFTNRCSGEEWKCMTSIEREQKVWTEYKEPVYCKIK